MNKYQKKINKLNHNEKKGKQNLELKNKKKLMNIPS